MERGPGNIITLNDGTGPAAGSATCRKTFGKEGNLKFVFKFAISRFNPEAAPGDGFCMALLDASNPDHHTPGDYGAGLGYDNRAGAVLGVGFDMGGGFGGNEKGCSVVVKSGQEVLYVADDVELEMPVIEANIQFSFAEGSTVPLLTVMLDEMDIISALACPGLEFPEEMKIGFTASTASLGGNRHTLMSLKVNDEK